MGHTYEYFETSFLGDLDYDDYTTTKIITITVTEETVAQKRKIESPILFD